MATILDDSPANIERLAQALLEGRLVAVPTETVYGLAAHALDPAACARIFEAKGRPPHDPLIVHVRDLDMLDLVAERSPEVEELAKAFWPGPLTLILKKKAVVPEIVTSGLDTVAVRISAHPGMKGLMDRTDRPLAAPSANPFGYISPTTSAHVSAQLGDRIEFILEGGPCPIGLESTILDLVTEERPRILRPGAITEEQIRLVLGRDISGFDPSTGRTDPVIIAPGLLDRHYSPSTPMQLRPKAFAPHELEALPAGTAALCFRKPGITGDNIFWLSEDGDEEVVARRLFSVMRDLDQKGFSSIQAEPAPSHDNLGPAINDRLRRAAGKG